MEEGLDSPVQEGCGIKDRGWRRTGLGLALGNGAHALGFFFPFEEFWSWFALR